MMAASVARRELVRRTLIGRPVNAHQGDGRQLTGGDVELRHQLLAIGRQAVFLGNRRSLLRLHLDHVLVALPSGGLVPYTAFGGYHAVLAGREGAPRGAIVEHELPGSLPHGKEVAARDAVAN